MGLNRKSYASATPRKRATVLPGATETPNTRKRAGESLATKAKKIKIEFQEVFEQFKKAHTEEISSIVLSMGSGDAGQLGLGSECMDKKRPYPIEGLTDIVTIRAGGMHNICLSKSGKVFTFGCNDEFVLGRKIIEDDESMVPGEVILPPDCHVVDITAGDNHCGVLTENGKVYIWGSFRDSSGVIGLLKPNEVAKEPVEVVTGYNIVKIASGENHFVMLTDSGEILTFGCAEQGQLGRIREVYLVRGGKAGMGDLLTPSLIRVKNHLFFSDIWAGSYCTVAKSIDGDIYGCGLNNYTQLGISNELSVLLMTKMHKFNNLQQSWKSFVFGLQHTIALTESKKVFVIGRGDYGCLGLGNNINQEDVTELTIEESSVKCIAACSHVSYVLLENGTALSCGVGNAYQLGHGDEDDVNVLSKVTGKFIADKKIIEVSVGGQHVLFRAVKIPEPVKEEIEKVSVIDEKENVDGKQTEEEHVEEKNSVIGADRNNIEERKSIIDANDQHMEENESEGQHIEEKKSLVDFEEKNVEMVTEEQNKQFEMEVVEEEDIPSIVCEDAIPQDNNNNVTNVVSSVTDVIDESKTTVVESMEH